MIKSDIQTIARWVSKVRKQTSAGKEDVDAESMETVTEWLAQDFPVRLFTPATAKLVAESFNGYWPRWGPLKALLTEYQDRNPTQPRIAYQASENLQERFDAIAGNTAHVARLADCAQQARADWKDAAKVRESVRKIGYFPLRDMLGKLLYCIVRKHAPENLGYIPPEFHMTEAEFAKRMS